MNTDFISGRVLMLALIVALLLVAMAVIVAAALMQKPTRQWRVQWQENTSDLRRSGIKTLKGEPVQPRMVRLDNLLSDPSGVNSQTLVLHPVAYDPNAPAVTYDHGFYPTHPAETYEVYDQELDQLAAPGPLDEAVPPFDAAVSEDVQPVVEPIDEEDEYEAEDIEFHMPAASEEDEEDEESSDDVDYFAGISAWFAATRTKLSDRYEQWSSDRADRKEAIAAERAAAEEAAAAERAEMDVEAEAQNDALEVPPPPPPPANDDVEAVVEVDDSVIVADEEDVPEVTAEAGEIAASDADSRVEDQPKDDDSDRKLVIVDWLDEEDLTTVKPDAPSAMDLDVDDDRSIEEHTAALLSEWLRDFSPAEPLSASDAAPAVEKWREYIPQLSEAEISKLRPSLDDVTPTASSDSDN